MTTIRNMKFSGAQAKVLCREAKCPYVSSAGCRLLRSNIWQCFAKQFKDAKEGKA